MWCNGWAVSLLTRGWVRALGVEVVWRCLSSVGEVVEFGNIRRQLQVLEDRLDSAVQPRLTHALSNRRVDVVQEMCAVLLRIRRFKSLELHNAKINLGTGEAAPKTKALAKGILDMSNGDLPKDADPQVVLDALKAVYVPYESFKRQYLQMEYAVLSGEIAGLNLRGAAVTPENTKSLRAACGPGVDAISTKKDTVAERREAASNARKVDFTSDEEWSFAQVSRSSIDQNKPDVNDDGTGQLSVARKAALDVAAVRLVDIPEKARKLLNYWSSLKTPGATALYMEQHRGIQYITDRGAQQLSVDIEYLSNTCFSTPKDQLKDLITSDSGNQLDLPTANPVCKMRQISLE
ncbi:hypothetical protein FXO38_06693 [Capsicum annuum]|nr:hypothetical protein FXO37_15779 [Capsicum annuum]KAF3671181.1 hypothetical protein FXO38_06693 [Capsicum annuum]